MTEQINGRAKPLSNGLLLGRSEMLRSLRHYLRAQGNDRADRLAGKATLKWLPSRKIRSVEKLDTTCGHKAKDNTQFIAWRREAWKEEALDDLP